MLETLKIENVALIKTLEIDFSSGFNIIMGETGAGKSIIIDALNFVLGDKADKTLIRFNEETMKVSALFSVSNQVKNLLSELGFEEDDQVLLSRTYSQSGKGECRINGQIVPVAMLKQLGFALVSTLSQNESIGLLKQKNHLSILDNYKSSDLIKVKEELEAITSKLNELSKEIKSYGGSEANRIRQIDMLKFQINEIENANILENEDIILQDKLTKLSNADKISNALSNALSCLENDNAGLDLIRSAISSLSQIENYDENASKIISTLQESLLGVQDSVDFMYQIREEYDVNPRDLDNLLERKDVLDNLKHKYGGNLSEVQNFMIMAKNELDNLENAEEYLAKKQEERKKLLELAQEKFIELSEKRREHAKELEEKISLGLKDIGILNAKFKVDFISLTQSLSDIETYNVNSFEDVEFLFSANVGEELKPLAKTISGGEMNRFMLIFKNIVAEESSPETLIFDEIDSGISGHIAVSVAKKIAKLSKKYQILCISHLPQVVSMGDTFYYVSKSDNGQRTETTIRKLTDNEIVHEICELTYGAVDENKLNLTKDLLKTNLQTKSTLE
ncbi:MAG: DNA repair protein RecN [Christensenellales bacterium]